MKFIIILITLIILMNVFGNISYAENQTTNNSFFDNKISFNVEYKNPGDVIPYVLISPSTASNYEALPLLVYLPGDGDINVSSNSLLTNPNGVPQIIQGWDLENFNAYILIPHIKDVSDKKNAYSDYTKIQNLLDKIIEEYNIDTDNVVLSGGSRGAMGSFHIGYRMPEYFSKIVIISGFYNDYYKKIAIPTDNYIRGYVGEYDADGSIQFMNDAFRNHFGIQNLYTLKGYNHDNILWGVFTQDGDEDGNNKNNRSNLIEWLFEDVTLKPVVTGINLNSTYLNLLVGDTSTLSVSPQPTGADLSDKTITWTTSNASVATVNSQGVITAVGPGTTTITATVLGFNAECRVTVKNSLNLNKSEIILPVQQIMQLTVISEENLTNTTITWSSLDETIAQVSSSGLITALKEGTTTIKATLDNQEVTCNVTVSGMLGDFDKDGEITSYDAYKALEVSVDFVLEETIEEQYILLSDVNRNGVPESEDAYNILRYSINLIDKF